MTLTSRLFNRLVKAALAALFALLVLAGVAVVTIVGENERRAGWVAHTYEVERALDRFTINSEQLETARRGYLLWRHDTAVANLRRALAAMPAEIAAVAALTRDNPAQQRHVVDLRRGAAVLRGSALETIARADSPNPAMAAMADFSVDRSFFSMVTLRQTIAAMQAEENRLLAVRAHAQDRAALWLDWALAAVALLILIGMAAMVGIVLRYTAELDLAQEELRSLNSGLEDAVAARTTELSRANDEIQRFAYIVSHDLRSPLVNVMGFTAELEATIAPLTTLIDRVDAEAPALMTPEARDAKADLPEAIGFIRTSTSKMDRLINSILRLSREGRRTLLPAAIDLGAMLGTIRDSFAHRITELGAEIDIAGPFPPLVSDPLALEQILSNLVENAVKYLQPGRPGRIAVAGRADGARVVIDVADNGRGIAPGDHERIFELFRRSGVQDQPGEGLGLAHVRALAYRLGGTITCISRLGAGATFRLSLPARLEVDRREGAVR